MERRNAKPSREIVVPGDILDTKGVKGGDNTYVMDGKLYASVLGVKNVSPNGISVIPLGGVYMPSTGDTVIGIINDIGASNWMVDISAPYPAIQLDGRHQRTLPGAPPCERGTVEG